MEYQELEEKFKTLEAEKVASFLEISKDLVKWHRGVKDPLTGEKNLRSEEMQKIWRMWNSVKSIMKQDSRVRRDARREGERKKKKDDAKLRKRAGIHLDRKTRDFSGGGTPIPSLALKEAVGPETTAKPEPTVKLEDKAKTEPLRFKVKKCCYICKTKYDILHHFYDWMCTACGDFNFAKRSQTADMKGYIALVTGGRIKIGYLVALKLLRAGASVIVTSRFPGDAQLRFSKEPDYNEFSDRLKLYGLDFRLIPAVEGFARHLCETLPRLDVLINNAAQTIRRPPVFYKHLLAGELRGGGTTRLDPPLLPPSSPLFLTYSSSSLSPSLSSSSSSTSSLSSLTSLLPVVVGGNALGGMLPADMSQLILTKEDQPGFYSPAIFPEGKYDLDGQQIDLRRKNTWNMGIEDVSTVELCEVQAVNAIAPFILFSKLIPLLKVGRGKLRNVGVTGSIGSDIPRNAYVISVSSMEGSFANQKKSTHPHTNMAKAALNMSVRTSAADLVKDRIFLNAVDTGWNTDEYPHVPVDESEETKGENKEDKNKDITTREHTPTPLDCEDGASRILDPIFTGVKEGNCDDEIYGCFLKDYEEADW